MGLKERDKVKVELFFAVGQTKPLKEYCADHGLNYKTVFAFLSKSFDLKMALCKHATQKGSLSTLEREKAIEAVERTFTEEQVKRSKRNARRRASRANDPDKEAKNAARRAKLADLEVANPDKIRQIRQKIAQRVDAYRNRMAPDKAQQVREQNAKQHRESRAEIASKAAADKRPPTEVERQQSEVIRQKRKRDDELGDASPENAAGDAGVETPNDHIDGAAGLTPNDEDASDPADTDRNSEIGLPRDDDADAQPEWVNWLDNTETREFVQSRTVEGNIHGLTVENLKELKFQKRCQKRYTGGSEYGIDENTVWTPLVSRTTMDFRVYVPALTAWTSSTFWRRTGEQVSTEGIISSSKDGPDCSFLSSQIGHVLRVRNCISYTQAHRWLHQDDCCEVFVVFTGIQSW